MAEKKTKINQRKLVYVLAAIIIILALAVIYFAFLKGPIVPVITSSEEASNLQQNISQTLTDIKSTLKQINESLGK